MLNYSANTKIEITTLPTAMNSKWDMHVAKLCHHRKHKCSMPLMKGLIHVCVAHFVIFFGQPFQRCMRFSVLMHRSLDCELD